MAEKAKRPNASFVFDAKEWLVGVRYRVLSLKEQGRLIRQIMRAVDERDEEFLADYRDVVLRVYWREKVQREPLNGTLRRTVLDRDGHRCAMCGSGDRVEIDHVIPWSKGGRHELDNLRVLCKPCNRRKGAKMPAEISAEG